jgi:hypothetical protein
MQTMAPPEDALTERFARLDERIIGVDRRLAETAKETNRRLQEVDRRITESKQDNGRRFKEVNRRIDENTDAVKELRGEMSSLRIAFQRSNYMQFAAMLGVIAAILAKGG